MVSSKIIQNRSNISVSLPIPYRRPRLYQFIRTLPSFQVQRATPLRRAMTITPTTNLLRGLIGRLLIRVVQRELINLPFRVLPRHVLRVLTGVLDRELFHVTLRS